jgi:hypothetical protein
MNRPRQHSGFGFGAQNGEIDYVNLGQRLKQLGYRRFGVGQCLLLKSRGSGFEWKAAIPWVNVSRPPMNFQAIADFVQPQPITPYFTSADTRQDALDTAPVHALSQSIQAGL